MSADVESRDVPGAEAEIEVPHNTPQNTDTEVAEGSSERVHTSETTNTDVGADESTEAENTLLTQEMVLVQCGAVGEQRATADLARDPSEHVKISVGVSVDSVSSAQVTGPEIDSDEKRLLEAVGETTLNEAGADSDSEDGFENPIAQGSEHLSARRKIQNAKFCSW